jgi:hypothetical protein
MHKDTPPGIFNFAERPIKHVVWVCLAIGVTIGVMTRVIYILFSAHFTSAGAPWAGQ